MNNIFLAAPDCCASSADIKHLLNYFGARTGRYLLNYPNSWKKELQDRFADASDLERARVMTAFRRAKERLSLVEAPGAIWNPNQKWLDNADAYFQRSQRIDNIVVPILPLRPYHLQYDDLDDLPLTAEERIDATPAEFVRVTNFLMLLSKELFFVDPYLNPCKQEVKVVMAELLALVARGQCGEIWIYSRQSCVMRQRGFTWGEVCGALDSLLSVIKPRRKLGIHYHLLDDEQSSDKMHARYAFSVRGGVRVDNGFQRLPRGRKTDVAPLSEPVLDELITMFAERADKLPVVSSYMKVIEP